MDAASNQKEPIASAKEAMRCRHCGAKLQHTLIDLGMSPLCESFLTRDQLDEPETYYPLHTRVCDQCWLVQLPEFVSPAHIFTEYAYFSSFSTSWVDHAGRYCKMIRDRLDLGPTSFVVELGSNDGYLLQHFVALGLQVLGIEPAANVAEAARKAGVPTLNAFFGPETARQVVGERGHADLIVANNVLAQAPELNGFIAGMTHLLAPEGVITVEVPHLERLMAENQFDTIYHEHFSYFSLGTMARLAAARGLRLIDVETLSTHGGSLRVYLAHKRSRHPVSIRVADMLAQERRAGLETVAAYADFAAKVQRTKRELLSVLIQAKEDGKRICGYGAPGKGNTLLNYAGIGTDFLDFTVDRNPYKHGRYTPGMHIPIRPVEAIGQAKPDYILILPWNLKDEIAQQMRNVADWGAKFIVPIPSVSIIDPRGLSC
jgi:SAM-dependent methyltransferase